MSSKDILDLKQRVFYIDKHVNTFFNKEIMKLHLNVSKLHQRLVALEKGTSNTTEDLETNIPVKSNEPKPQKSKKKQSRSVTNIRTVNLG